MLAPFSVVTALAVNKVTANRQSLMVAPMLAPKTTPVLDI